MTTMLTDMDILRDIPGYKAIMKAVLKTQIQLLVEQLCDHTGEESIILTASVNDGSLSHLGSDLGKGFLDGREEIKSQFLGYCLKGHHKIKTQETEQPYQRSNTSQPSPRTPVQQHTQKRPHIPLASASEASHVPQYPASDSSFVPPAAKRQFRGRKRSQEPVGDIVSQGEQSVRQSPIIESLLKHELEDTGYSDTSQLEENANKDCETGMGVIVKEEPGVDAEEDLEITGFEMPDEASESWDQNTSGETPVPSNASFNQSTTQSGYDVSARLLLPSYSKTGETKAYLEDFQIHVSEAGNRQTSNQDRAVKLQMSEKCCLDCGKIFRDRVGLERHIRIHTGEKPYVCEVDSCKRAFRQKVQLVLHNRSHTGERPYGCDMCGKTYLSKSHLNNHILRKHVAQIP